MYEFMEIKNIYYFIISIEKEIKFEDTLLTSTNLSILKLLYHSFTIGHNALYL